MHAMQYVAPVSLANVPEEHVEQISDDEAPSLEEADPLGQSKHLELTGVVENLPAAHR